MSEMRSAFNQASPQIRKVMSPEISTLAKIAPWGVQGDLNDTLRSAPAIPSREEASEFRQRVTADPFDLNLIEKFKEVESKRGEHTMVAYLTNRLDQLKQGQKQ